MTDYYKVKKYMSITQTGIYKGVQQLETRLLELTVQLQPEAYFLFATYPPGGNYISFS